MKKTIKIIAGAVLSVVLSMGITMSAVGCGGGDKEGVLIISAYDGGYGLEWVNEIANKFTQETGTKVEINPYVGQAGVTTIRADVESGTSSSDLIISKDVMFDKIYMGTTEINGTKYDNFFEDLTPLYNSKVTGEKVKLIDKIDPLFADYYNVGGKYYGVPWASGMIGLIRNNKVWKAEWETPRTTDELFALADKIKATYAGGKEEIAPFIYSEADEYWSMISHVWIAQYKGSEEMKKFYQGYDSVGERYSEDMFEDDGFNETLEILARLLKKDNGYMHSTSRSTDFTNMQGSFLKGRAVFTPNGDWIENEMKNSYRDADIEFIHTPVISALANLCSFKNAEDKDSKLAQLVDYVDNHKTGYDGKPEWATNEDVDKVRDARSIEYTVGHEHYMAIPAYSNEKELAKSFILFMASNKGIETYMEKTGGCVLPYEYDYASKEGQFSEFRKKTSNLINQSNLMFASKKDRIFSLGGVDMYWFNDKNKGRVVPSLSSSTPRTAAQIVKDNNDYLKAHWVDIKAKANIK